MKKLFIGMFIGIALTLTSSVFADQVKQYVLTKIGYPILVNGSEYSNSDLPALNYNGSTYLPLRAIGEVLGKKIKWNDGLKRVEIGEGSDNAMFNPTPVPTPNLTPPSTQTPTPTPSPNIPEVLKDYKVYSGAPALKYNGENYIAVYDATIIYKLQVLSWGTDNKSLQFEGSNQSIFIKVDYNMNGDGFIYNGSSYIKESIVQTISNAIEQDINAEYQDFKLMFLAGTKILNLNNTIEVSATYLGNKNKDDFIIYWNGNKIKKQLIEKYAIELQSVNPQSSLFFGIYYNGVFLGNTNVDTNKSVSTFLIDNPYPDQNSIKQ